MELAKSRILCIKQQYEALTKLDDEGENTNTVTAQEIVRSHVRPTISELPSTIDVPIREPSAGDSEDDDT